MGGLPTVHYALAEGWCQVWFPYNDRLIQLIRAVPGRKWDPESRMWCVPAAREKELLLTRQASDVRIRREQSAAAQDAEPPQPIGISKMDLQRAGGVLILGFAYDKGMLSVVRKVPGRRWFPDHRYWTIPEQNLDTLRELLRTQEWHGVLWDKDTGHAIDLEVEEKLGTSVGGEGGKARSAEQEERDERARELVDFEQAFQATQIPDVDISDVHFLAAGTPMEHQLDFMRFAKDALSKDAAGILVCDEQGLGKSVEAINLALYRRQTQGIKHCLIICCVNSNVRNWTDEVALHTGGAEQAYVLGQKKSRGGTLSIGSSEDKLRDLKRLETDSDAFPFFLVTNIETIRMAREEERREDMDAQSRKSAGARRRKKKAKGPRTVHPVEDQLIRLIRSGTLGMVVVDEVHKNTSARSQQGRGLWRVKRGSDGSECCWVPMTGTPLVNRPSDLFLPLGLCGGHDYKNFQSFEARFCPGEGRTLTDCQNLGELRVLLKRKMIRRRKEDALDLPEKTHLTEYVQNTDYQKALYDETAAAILREIEEARENGEAALNMMNPLAVLLRLRQVNGSPELVDGSLSAAGSDYLKCNAKMARLVELVKGILENGDKALVFSNWSQPLETVARFMKPLTDFAVITGEVAPAARMDAKKRFQEDPDCAVMLGTIGAMGVGLTLTAAQHVIFLDEPWTPADKEQAEDRAHRIGTKGTVFIHTLITEDTVDQRVHDIVYAKSQMAALMVDGSMNVGGKNVDFRTDPALLRHLILGEEEMQQAKEEPA